MQFDSPQDDLSLWKNGAESYIMARGLGGVMRNAYHAATWPVRSSTRHLN